MSITELHMRCYLKGYKDDRTCDICEYLNKKQHDRCKMDYKIWRNNNLLLMCEYCSEEKVWKSGTNEYGCDEDYLSTFYRCEKTKLECNRQNMTEDCLDRLIMD